MELDFAFSYSSLKSLTFKYSIYLFIFNVIPNILGINSSILPFSLSISHSFLSLLLSLNQYLSIS